jgi:hypothetical protein
MDDRFCCRCPKSPSRIQSRHQSGSGSQSTGRCSRGRRGLSRAPHVCFIDIFTHGRPFLLQVLEIQREFNQDTNLGRDPKALDAVQEVAEDYLVHLMFILLISLRMDDRFCCRCAKSSTNSIKTPKCDGLPAHWTLFKRPPRIISCTSWKTRICARSTANARQSKLKTSTCRVASAGPETIDCLSCIKSTGPKTIESILHNKTRLLKFLLLACLHTHTHTHHPLSTSTYLFSSILSRYPNPNPNPNPISVCGIAGTHISLTSGDVRQSRVVRGNLTVPKSGAQAVWKLWFLSMNQSTHSSCWQSGSMQHPLQRTRRI